MALLALRVFVVFVVGLGTVTSAHAIRCSDWTRLNNYQRHDTLQQLFRDAPNHSSLRGRSFSGTRLELCLSRMERWIEADFDEACSRGRAANMQALNDIMRHYIVSCTSGRRASYP